MEEDPWEELSNKYSSGLSINGRVIKILDKGIIFELEEGVEGILKAKDKSSFEIDKEYDLTVQGVDLENKKIIIMDDLSIDNSAGSTDEEDTSDANNEDDLESESSEDIADTSDSAEENEEDTNEPEEDSGDDSTSDSE